MAATLLHLAELPSLHAELRHMLTTKTPGTELSGGSSSPASRPPLRLEVLDSMIGALPALREWALSMASVLKRQGPGEDMSSVCWWLSWAYRDYQEVDEEGAAYFEEAVGWWHSNIRGLLGERDTQWPIHECGWAIMPRGKGSWYGCTGCGEVLDVSSGLRRLGTALPLSRMREETGVKLNTLKQWVKRGKLTPVVEARPALYAVEDVLACLSDSGSVPFSA